MDFEFKAFDTIKDAQKEFDYNYGQETLEDNNAILTNNYTCIMDGRNHDNYVWRIVESKSF